MSSKDRNIFTENSHDHGNSKIQRLSTDSNTSKRAPHHLLQLQRSGSSGSEDCFDVMKSKLEEKKRSATATATAAAAAAAAAAAENSSAKAEDEDPLKLMHELEQVLKSEDEETEEEEKGGDDVSKEEEQNDDSGEEQQQTFSKEDGNDTKEEHETDQNEGEGSKDDTGGSAECDFWNHLDKVAELQSYLIALNTLSTACLENPTLMPEIHNLVVKTSNSFADMFKAVCDDYQNISSQSLPLAQAAAEKIVTKISVGAKEHNHAEEEGTEHDTDFRNEDGAQVKGVIEIEDEYDNRSLISSAVSVGEKQADLSSREILNDGNETSFDANTSLVSRSSSTDMIPNLSSNDASEGAVEMAGAVVSEDLLPIGNEGTATAAVTDFEDHLKVDIGSFNQLANVLDNTEINTLVAAPDLPILRLVQSLVGLSFKTHKDLYQNLKHVAFHFLSVLSPLSKLNKVFGAFLRAEAAEMESVVDLGRSGLGSIVSYCEKKTSDREADDSEVVPDEVYEIKEAIYRAVHGTTGDDGNAEKLRSLINDKVKISHVKRHVTMGFDTNNLLMHVLNLYFVVAILSELSILETFRHLSKKSSLIESVKEFARSANPEVVFEEDMKVIDYLSTYVTPALEKEDLLDDAWMITCSILWNLNKIVAVGSKASNEARKNDQRKKKLVPLFRSLECQTISGMDTSAVVFWSGTDEVHSVRRLRAFRTFAVHFLRRPIEKSLSTDCFTKFGFTRSFLYISSSSIGRECTFITPKVFSKCQDNIPKKVDNMMKKLSKKDSTGKRTIFIEGAEQRSSLKLLLDAYEALV